MSAIIVVGSLSLWLIAITMFVKLGDRWIPSTSCLVMACPAIAVNYIKTTAPQLFMLREASSSMTCFSFQEEQGLKLLKNATQRKR